MKENELVRRSFLDVRMGFSADRVIADPVLNQLFVDRCIQLGAKVCPTELNLSLLNLRKAGLLKGLRRPAQTRFRDDVKYCHASEIAARFLEKRDSITLDRILCDPEQANEFDSIASDIAPGFTSLQYRWAALKLRKKRILRPELLSRVVKPTSVTLGPIENVNAVDLPVDQGIYIFHCSDQTLYVGEASSIRRRVSKHLDHSDNKNLAIWFWTHGFENVRLELQVLDCETTTTVRRALEAELILTRRPTFNVQRLLRS